MGRHFLPIPSLGFIQVWRRHFLVWRKTAGASLSGALGEPLLYILGMGFGLASFIPEINSMPYLVYVGAGILAANSMNTSTFESLYGAFTRMTRQNTFHAMLATPLKPEDVVLGEITWSATKTLISGSAILLVGSFFGAFPEPTAILALPVAFLSGLAFSGLAMIVTALSPSYEFFLYYTTLGTTPMFLFCGVFYPPQSLPDIIQTITLFFPLTHTTTLIRGLTSGTEVSSPLFHLAVLALFALISYVISVHLIRRRIIV
ncbi:ABC transporter permease [Magnetococcales bacterium HHB-1]